MIQKQSLKYIIEFLTNQDLLDKKNGIAYTKDIENCNSKIIIYPSKFFDDGVFGTQSSMPILPLKLLDNMPILFGEPKIEKKGDQIVIYADLIASTFFLISRYEETIHNGCKDSYGRFVGKKSIPYKCNFIEYPLVDKYALWLQNTILKNNNLVNNKPKIILTHDIDVPYIKYNFFTAGIQTFKNIIKRRKPYFFPYINLFINPKKDPRYTFDKLINLDKEISNSETIYFVKAGGTDSIGDGPIYIHDKYFMELYNNLVSSGASFGYHVSYSAGKNPSIIKNELLLLKNTLKIPITKSRNHYLLSLNPSDMNYLIENNITDDYTIGYPDIAGFRLGTCRAVKWINPYTTELTSLTLHPLIIMECSLSSPSYMNLPEKEAEVYAKKLIDNVYLIPNSELVLLWHNNVYPSRDWKLYEVLIEYLKNK